MVAGSRPGGSTRKPVRKYSTEVRKCSVCDEKLSAYNPGPNCFAHATSPSGKAASRNPR